MLKFKKITLPSRVTAPARMWLTGARKLGANKAFRRLYPVASLLVLLATSAYWALLGARLQAGNADQLSDPYLFSNWATFHGAVFPGSHTFLLKWPIFWVMRIFGTSATSLELATVAVVLATIGALAAILYKIERRPFVFGALCLGLSLVLLLVPAQPYAGALLPVNMAMLTTRNIEYIVYIISLIYFVRANRLKSLKFVMGVTALSLLIASDKLFLGLSVGGSLLGLVVYSLARNWAYVTFSVRWLMGTVAAAVGSTLILFLITSIRLTHLTQSGASPYTAVSTAKEMVLGMFYGIFGLLTNSGANPIYDMTEPAHIPAHLFSRVFSLSGVLHLFAAGLAAYMLLLVWCQTAHTLHNLPRKSNRQSVAAQLSAALVLSIVAALVVFVGTNHYYAVDARYLAIVTFALPIVGATMLRKKKFRPEYVVSFGAVLLAGVVFGIFAAHGNYVYQKQAYANTATRNNLVAQALKQHKVGVLIGDYWRVLPIRAESANTLNVLPLGNCTEPRSNLTSSAWTPDLTKTSFAYLVSIDTSMTDFPLCSLPQITAKYGRPSATQVIAGTVARPREVLMFYDYGLQRNARLSSAQASSAAAILPISPQELIGTGCDSPTVMNVVAHQDDDLLFTSPDLIHDIHSGRCVRTVFLTAGDDGNGKFYWLNRERGSEAAYDAMLGYNARWQQRTVRLTSTSYITVASPQDNAKISLIFFHLPDGGIHGLGFPASKDESMAKLQNGTIPLVHAIDGQSMYTSAQLVSALSSLMNTYQPAEIHTQANAISEEYPDHSDHMATGKFARQAAAQYVLAHFGDALSIPVKYYIGYPTHGYRNNVSGNDLLEKEKAFLAYAKYDGSVCQTLVQCVQTPTYGAYIARQYQEVPAPE